MSDFFNEWCNTKCINSTTNKEIADKFIDEYFHIINSHTKICGKKNRRMNIRIYIKGYIKVHRDNILKMIYFLSA